MEQLAKFIREGSEFAVISHISPDGDTMGCAAALLYGIEKLGKKGQWFCEGGIPENMLEIEEIADLTKRPRLENIDSVISVDTVSFERMGSCADVFKRISHTAQIDHHKTNDYFAQINYVEECSACCFLVYKLLLELNVEIDDKIARSLFVGISTDTGRLAHTDVTPEDVLLTSELYRYNIRQEDTTDILFRDSPIKNLKMKGRAMQHMETALDGKVAYTYLDKEDFEELEADSTHSEGVIELVRSVKGAKIAFFMRQIGNAYKISIRSGAEYDVSQICEKFGGGGHKQAAGCIIEGSLWNVVMTLIKEIEAII